MPGPMPKPANIRARQNRKAGATTLDRSDSHEIPDIPNPDNREWHPLTVSAWENAWSSPMAGQWLKTDEDALGRLAVLWDEYYKKPGSQVIAEIRLQEQRFGLSPLDRSRLQWEVNRADESEQKQQRRKELPRRTGTDPRAVLMAIK